jgi:hypothetical protein
MEPRICELDRQSSRGALRLVVRLQQRRLFMRHPPLKAMAAATQATAADLLRALGIDRDPAHERVVEAADEAFSRSSPIARSRATTAVHPPAEPQTKEVAPSDGGCATRPRFRAVVGAWPAPTTPRAPAPCRYPS